MPAGSTGESRGRSGISPAIIALSAGAEGFISDYRLTPEHSFPAPDWADWTELNRGTMTCKIDRVLNPDGFVVLRVSGRIERAHVEALRELTEKERTTTGLAIDLSAVTVVSLDAVRALTVAEVNGIELRNCPAYVREWISRVRESGLPE